MEAYFLSVTTSFLKFVRYSLGTARAPYSAFRQLSLEKGNLGHVIFLYILVVLYFAFASLVREGFNPFFLSMKFNILTAGFFVGNLLVVSLIYFFGRFFNRSIRIKTVFRLWTYSLWPTLLWFLATTLLYIVLPPPRSLSLSGKAYSIIYLISSASLFYWKVILYYLTVRFSVMKGIKEFLIISLALSLVVGPFAYLMYRLSVFKVPFI